MRVYAVPVEGAGHSGPWVVGSCDPHDVHAGNNSVGAVLFLAC